MGLWARGNPDPCPGHDERATSSDQGHTQSVGSAESFAAQYEFFTGQRTGARRWSLPEPPGQVEISGRALNFPANTGIAGSTLDVYEVEPETGERRAHGLDTP